MTRSLLARLTGVCVAALALLAEPPAQAQIPFYYTTRPQGVGMRSAAMADALSSDSWDATTMYWNPGGLSFVRTASPIFTHFVDWTTKAQTEQLVAPSITYGPIAFSASGMLTHGGRIDAGENIVVAYKEIGLDIAVSYLLLPTLSIGVLGGGRRSTFDETAISSAWSQVGIFYYPSPGIAYGMAYRAYRGATFWAANAQSGVGPQSDIQQNLELGATMTYPARSDRPVVTMSLTTEKYFPGVSLFSTKGGVEVFPWHFFVIRVGFKVGSVERIGRYGFGVHIDPVHLDFAIAPSRSENRFHGVSLAISL